MENSVLLSTDRGPLRIYLLSIGTDSLYEIEHIKISLFYVILHATIKLNIIIMYGAKFKALERVQENHKMVVNIHFPLFD